MSKIDDEVYFNHKKRSIISTVNDFRNKYGESAFPVKLDYDTLDLEKVFCNSKLCSECGECCCTAPCIFSPNDFLEITDIKYMRRILDTGLITISKLWEGDNTLILRPRGAHDKNYIYTTTYGPNNCILEDGDGCMLPVQYRPRSGLLRIPYNCGEYVEHLNIYDRRECAREYKQFQDTLETLALEYQWKPVQKYTHEEKVNKVNTLIKSLGKRQ